MSDASKNKKWIVGIIPDVPGINSNRIMGKIVKLKDPGTNEFRDYGLLVESCNQNQCTIVEFQSIPADFSSFVVGRHIVKDGNIYVINPIDPLFFYLSTHLFDESQSGINNDNKHKQQQSWQSFDQCLENSKLPREFYEAISEKQMRHICSTFSNDDICYLKFSVEKTLQWLQSKQERVLESLIRQHKRNRKTKDAKYASLNNNRTGTNNSNTIMGESISENFNLPPPSHLVATPSSNEIKNTNTNVTIELSETKALKNESIQIICNYLNQGWSNKFITHLKCTTEVLSTSKTVNKAAGVSNINNSGIQHNIDNDMSSKKLETTNQKPIVSARTSGNKRLVKVSTKGMKSIGNFFKKAKH